MTEDTGESTALWVDMARFERVRVSIQIGPPESPVAVSILPKGRYVTTDETVKALQRATRSRRFRAWWIIGQLIERARL